MIIIIIFVVVDVVLINGTKKWTLFLSEQTFTPSLTPVHRGSVFQDWQKCLCVNESWVKTLTFCFLCCGVWAGHLRFITDKTWRLLRYKLFTDAERSEICALTAAWRRQRPHRSRSVSFKLMKHTLHTFKTLSKIIRYKRFIIYNNKCANMSLKNIL